MEVSADSRSLGIRPRQWFPDESLYSFCTRFHILGGDPCPSATLKHHFGRQMHACLQDLPANLDFFAERNNGNLGDWVSLLWDRTMAPFYLPFMSSEKARELVRNMKMGDTARIRTPAMSCTSQLGLHNVLKQCQACVEDDDATHYMAYWHRSHQLPGVWCCPIHDQPLFVSLIRPDKQLHLPHAAYVKTNQYRVNDAIRRLSEFTLQACRLDLFFQFDRQKLQRCYSKKLTTGSEASFGLGLGSSALNWQAVGKSFFGFLASLREVPTLGVLPDTWHGAAHLVAVLLRQKRSLGNPFFHLCLATWLFESFSDFHQAYLHA